MKRVLKWVGYVVLALLVLIVAAVGTVWAITSSRLNKTYPTEVETVAIPTDSASIARGRHLVQAVGKCAECHGDKLQGMSMMNEPVFMMLTASNLTRGQGGIGSTYTDADWVRSIRYGVGRDGKPLIFMPSEAFNSFNDADLGAMIAYLKTIPPADLPVKPARAPGPIARIIYLTSGFPLIPATLIDRSKPRGAPVTPGVTVEYGKYLAQTGGCTSCHLPTLGGGGTMNGVKVANLTTGGPLKSWSEADFFKAIRTGTRPDGTKLKEEMPWKAMGTLTDDELRAMWMYIRSVRPVTTAK